MQHKYAVTQPADACLPACLDPISLAPSAIVLFTHHDNQLLQKRPRCLATKSLLSKRPQTVISDRSLTATLVPKSTFCVLRPINPFFFFFFFVKPS